MLGLLGILLAQFVIGPERPVAPARAGVSSPSQVVQGTASDGTNQLVVWLDERAAIPAHISYGSKVIAAARIDPHGKVLDIPNLILPMRATGAVLPFWNGREYVVVTGGSYMRISASGEILDPQPRTFPFPFPFVSSIAQGGDRLLFADSEHAVVYDTSFNLVRDHFLLFDNSDGFPPVVASNGDGFLAARTAWRELQIKALDRNGAELRGDTVLRAQDIEAARIASDGHGYLLIVRMPSSFLPYYGWYNYTFSAFAFSGQGIVTTAGVPFGAPWAWDSAADLRWQGDHYALAYVSTGGIELATIDRIGGADAHPVRLLDGTYPQSVLVSALGPRMLFWSTDTPRTEVHDTWSVLNGQPYGDPASFSAWASQRFDVGQGSLSQEMPAAATAGDLSLIAWRERDSARDPLALYATRIDRSGNPDPQPLRIANQTCDATWPAVATNGTDFLLAWEESSSIRAMRIARDGHPLDAAPIVLSEMTTPCGGLVPSIAWNGSDYLVLWRDDTALRAKLMKPDGTLRDVQPGIAGAKAEEFLAASDGHEFLITWRNNFQTSASRVSADGVLRDIGGFALSIHPQSLFWSGRNYVVIADKTYERINAQGQRIDGKPMQFPAFPASRDVQCSSDGCLAYGLNASAKAIVATRFDDGPGGVTMETKTLADAGDSAGWWMISVFGGAQKNIAYLRMPAETPYAGSWHLFVRPMLAPRARAVR
ncbi:MAG TPA: hypothetical protein VII75_09300 [Thermoanaerobaculia bacterium]|nr:hypothetical protein [Thermoanaerobaculia bacterium]